MISRHEAKQVRHGFATVQPQMEQHNEKPTISSIISNAIFQFSLTSLHKYARIKPQEDFVFSPYNIYQELFSIYLISTGDIEQRLKKILYLPEVSKFELMKIINFNKYPTKRHARYEAAFYLPHHYEILNKFIYVNTIFRENVDAMKRLYNFGFKFINCNDIQDLNTEINKILETSTMDCIRKPVDLRVKADYIDIILMNVHNFHGRNRLISQCTNKLTVAPSLLTTLFLNFETFSSDELQVDVIELIIEEHYTSLYMLIPFSSSTNKRVKTDRSSNSLSRLIKRLSTSKGMRKLRELLSCVKTGGSLSFATRPTFEIEKYLDMRVLLRGLGVEQLLTPNGIPLDSTFAKGDQYVHFGNAVHRARVEVTKENVTAAAVTLISGQEPCSDDIIKNMDMNYPFVWLIYDKMNADILYIGVFNKVNKFVPQIGLPEIDMTYKPKRRLTWSSGSLS